MAALLLGKTGTASQDNICTLRAPRRQRGSAATVCTGPFPDSDVHTTGNKGLVNGLVVVDESNPDAAKIIKIVGGVRSALTDDERDRLNFELEDVSVLASLGIATPRLLARGDNYFVMQLLPQEKVNWKLLTGVLHGLHKHTSTSPGCGVQACVVCTKKYPAKFGYHRPSFYGLRRLQNDWSDDWWDFFIRTRMMPTIHTLEQQGHFGLARAGRLTAELARLLPPPEAGCLLHGDIFPNNVLHNGKTETALIDPVCFFGDPLIDFAKFTPPKSFAHSRDTPRILVYQVYFALDFFAVTNDALGTTSESCNIALKKLLERVARDHPASLWPPMLAARPPILAARPPILAGRLPAVLPEGVGLICFGAFNPPHPNHLRLLEAAHRALELDGHHAALGLLVPAPDAYLAVQRKKTDAAQRLALTTREALLIGKAAPQWGVWTFVVNHKTTILAAEKTFGVGRWFVVCGSDSAALACDPARQGIAEHIGVVVVERAGYPVNESQLQSFRALRPSGVVLLVREEEEEWSSTKIRDDPALWSKMIKLS